MRCTHLSTGSASFPIISIVKVARKQVLLKFSTAVERYRRLPTETYIQDAAEKLNLTFLNYSHFISFGYEQFNFDILTLQLCVKFTWSLTYFDQFMLNFYKKIILIENAGKTLLSHNYPKYSDK